MPPSSPATACSPHYRRLARRLRCRLAHDPAKLHRGLAHLAQQHSAGRLDSTRPWPISPDDSNVYRDFARHIRASLQGSVLRYSQRLALLRQAAALGIGRFEANLLIAMVQHRSRATANPAPRRTHPVLSTVAIVLTVQGLIVLALVQIFGR